MRPESLGWEGMSVCQDLCTQFAFVIAGCLWSDASRGTLLECKSLCVCLCVCIYCLPSLQVFHLQFCLQGTPLLCFSPIGDTSEEGKEAHLCQATALRNCLRLPGISILDKLIKTCPIWLHLNMNQERAGVILGKETAGVSPMWFQFRQPHFLSLVELVWKAALFFHVEPKVFSRLCSLFSWPFDALATHNSTRQI